MSDKLIDNSNSVNNNVSDSNSDSEAYMLTTMDNPYNPFTQFKEWYGFDVSMGYCTCSYLARVAKTSEELSEVDARIAINDAINEILRLNLTGNYVKVTRDTFVDRSKSKISEK